MEPDVTDVTVCGYDTISLRATYNNGAALPMGAYFQWYARTGSTYSAVPPTTTSYTRVTLRLPAPASTGSLPPPVTYYVSINQESPAGSGNIVEGNKHAVTATYVAVPVLTVEAQKLCKGVPATVVLAVTNPNPGTTDYYWYDTDTQATSPYPAGPTFSPTLAAPRTYYVQAIPKSSTTGCASERTRVEVEYHQTIFPSQVMVPVAVVLGNNLQVSLDNTPGYTYSWNWGDNSAQPGNSTGNGSHLYAQVGGYDVQLTITDNNQPQVCSYTLPPYHVEVGRDLCNAQLPAGSLAAIKVRRSNRNGSFLFISNTPCATPTTAFACMTGPASPSGDGNLAVAASAVSLTDLPPIADPAYALSQADLQANPFLAGAGRLRPEATYTYATPVLKNDYSTERGRFQVVPFNWQVNPSYRLPAWRRAGQATRYSPDGQALEEQDILHIFSAVKLGYQGHSLPYLTAKNAQYQQVLFESFEHPNPLEGEDGFMVRTDEARGDTARSHSGRQCLLLLNAFGEGYRERRLTLPTFAGLNGEVQLQLWLRLTEAGKDEQALDKSKLLGQSTSSGGALQVRWNNTLTTGMNIIAQSGEWMLCEATVNLGMPSASAPPVQPVFVYTSTSPQWQVRVDDVRLQPLATQMSCYVYDWKTLKLLTSFDDQHFGLYYQYNAEGKLVRKQVETERGLMTIQETQYNLPRP
jgi:hypothetical protein